MIFFPVTPTHPTVESTMTRVIQMQDCTVLYWDIQKNPGNCTMELAQL